MKFKICSKCKIEKLISEFSKDKYNKDGYNSSCKICRNKTYHEWAVKNKVHKADYDKIRNQKLKVKKNNKLHKSEERKRKPWISSYFGAMNRCNNMNNPHYKNYGGRGIKFKLSQDEIKELWFRDRAYLLECPSIDRIDNDGHYEYSNCQFIERDENAKKKAVDNKKRQNRLNLTNYC